MLRCPLDAYRELAWAVIALPTDGFTVDTLADQAQPSAPLGRYVLPPKLSRTRSI